MLKKISKAYRHNKRLRTLSALLTVVAIAAIGTYLLVGSRAATPFASLNADQGTLGCGVSAATDSTASDGHKVTFSGCGNGTSSCTTTLSPVAGANVSITSPANGSTVCIKAGSYGKLSITSMNSINTTIEPDPSLDPNTTGKVTFSGIDIIGAYITVHNFYSTGGINFKPSSTQPPACAANPPAVPKASWTCHDVADHNDVTNGAGGYGIDLDCNTASSQPGCAYITINGNRVHGFTSTPSGDGDALRLDGWSNVTISYNEITQVEQLPGSNQGHTDCLQSYNANVATHDIVYDHNYIHDVQCQGFFLKDGDVSHNVTANDNLEVRGHNSGGSDTALFLYENTDNAHIYNNTYQNTNGSNITAGGSGAAAATVENNVFDQLNIGSPQYSLTENHNIFTDGNQWSFNLNSTDLPQGPYGTKYSPAFMCGSNCTPPNFTCADSVCSNLNRADDDYRLASNPNGIGIDWTPASQTYGPVK